MKVVTELREAILKGEISKLAAMIEFPVRINRGVYSRPSDIFKRTVYIDVHEAEFARAWDSIFPSDLVTWLKTESIDSLLSQARNFCGGYSFNFNGHIWVMDACNTQGKIALILNQFMLREHGSSKIVAFPKIPVYPLEQREYSK